MYPTLLSINNATVRFSDRTLFTGLNFRVLQGEHWALTGKSGSGKSALLSVIAGKLNISAGNITYDFCKDTVVSSANNNELSCGQLIAFVEAKHHFKNLSNTTSFYYQQRYNSTDSEDALTVDEYLLSVANKIGQPVCGDLEKVINMLKLYELKDKQLIKLSNGETKRLLIAAALLKNPALLLLDNPLTGLDVETRTAFNTIVNEITASGITIIMATAPDEIPDAITHIAVLKNGTIAKRFKKGSFDPSQFTAVAAGVINTRELSVLLSDSQPKKTYRYLVKMNDVTIKYGNKTVLDKINWQVAPAERWALLGSNGAGKSTLLSLINGDNPQAYANDIILFDRKRGTGESIWDIKSHIGFVSPELHQYFPTDNSCLQVIESGYYDTLGLFRPSAKSKAETALSWMKALEIEKYAHVLLKNVPSSVQRLCLLARALVKNPDLLILDEPCQGMDNHQQQHFKKLLDTICGLSNLSLIYVTHYQQEIPDSVTKVLKLNKGLVIMSKE